MGYGDPAHAIRKHWDAFYGRHAGVLPEFAWGNRTQDQHVVDFVAFVAPVPGKTALDVGCGHGKNTAFLARAGLRAVGVDFSRQAVSAAKKKVRSARFFYREAADLGFADSSFDLLVDAGCLHVNMPDTRPTILREYARVLQPGGHLFIRLFRRQVGHSSYRRPQVVLQEGDVTLPVWGVTRTEATGLFPSRTWRIIRTLFDRHYGHHGCYYLYVQKRHRATRAHAEKEPR